MKRYTPILFVLLLTAMIVPAAYGALAPAEPAALAAGADLSLQTTVPPAFGGGAPYNGTIEIGSLVPVTIMRQQTGSYFFLDTGEGTGDQISVSGASGSIMLPVTYYVPSSSLTQISLSTVAEDDILPGSDSQVPLPPALLLLGSGLAGLVGLRSRLRTQEAY